MKLSSRLEAQMQTGRTPAAAAFMLTSITFKVEIPITAITYSSAAQVTHFSNQGVVEQPNLCLELSGRRCCRKLFMEHWTHSLAQCSADLNAFEVSRDPSSSISPQNPGNPPWHASSGRLPRLPKDDEDSLVSMNLTSHTLRECDQCFADILGGGIVEKVLQITTFIASDATHAQHK